MLAVSHDGAVRRLLIMLCRRDALPERINTELTRLNDPVYRAAFLLAARELRVLGLALIRLERTAALDALEAQAAAELRALLRQVRRRAAEVELERDRLVTLLERRQVAPIVLKGCGLRAVLYAEPAERDAADIDLLVRPADVDTAIDVMVRARYEPPGSSAAMAYRSQHFHLRFVHPFNYIVEIHWALSEPHQPNQLDAHAFFLEPFALTRPARPTLRLPRHELGLLHLVLQNVQERFRWFNRLVDIDRFVTRVSLDWEFLESQAAAAGLTIPLALTFELARRMLGTPVPEAALRRLRPSRAVRAHLELLEPELLIVTPMRPRRSAADRLLDIWLTPRSRSRAAAFARLLTVDGFVDPRHVKMGQAERPGRTRRAAALLKVLTYQVGLYSSALSIRRQSSWGRDR